MNSATLAATTSNTPTPTPIRTTEPLPLPDATATPLTLIVIHGWGGNASMMLPLARPLHEAGFATLFVDARCHGASDEDDFASLPRFAEDIEHARTWLLESGRAQSGSVALLGHSVGAGAALLVASRQPGIAAVVSVGAFAHPDTVMRRWLASKWIPQRPIGNYILDYVQQAIGYRFEDIAPINTISRIRCPVLLAHGADDDVVPVGDARAIHARRRHERVVLRIVPGGHDDFADLEHQLGEVIQFLASAATEPNGVQVQQTPEVGAKRACGL